MEQQLDKVKITFQQTIWSNWTYTEREERGGRECRKGRVWEREYRMYTHDYMPCVCWCLKRSVRRALNPLELEVQAAVSHLSSPELLQN